MNYKEFKAILESYVNEASWNPVTKKIQDKPASREEIESLAAKARSKKKPRNPVGTTRKSSGSFKPSSPEEAKANKAAWDNYWSVAAKGYKEEFTIKDYDNILDERKYEPDEKLPSGKTPNEKMTRAQQKHGANYMLTPSKGRNNPARDSHFSRGRKVKKISDIIKSGEDPRNSPQAGVGWGNDARKIGRPGVSTADRTSRTQRNDDTDAKSTYTQGGLRAHKTKAGGYRTLKRKSNG